LEAWWQQKPFIGAYLCPYPRSDIEGYPHNMHLKSALQDHDIVVDANGKLLTEFMNGKNDNKSQNNDLDNYGGKIGR